MMNRKQQADNKMVEEKTMRMTMALCDADDDERTDEKETMSRHDQWRMGIHRTLPWRGVLMAVCVLWATSGISFAGTTVVSELMFKPSAIIAGPVVYVRDIAVSADPSLMHIAICKAPEPGKSRRMTRGFVMMRLKNNHIDTALVRVSGAGEIEIVRQSSVLTLAALTAAVKEHLHTTYGFDLATCSLTFDNLTHDLAVPGSDYAMTLTETSFDRTTAKLCMTLSVTADGAPWLTKLLSMQIFEERPVVVACQSLRAGTTIRAEHLTLERLRVSARAIYFDTPAAAQGKQAISFIRAGEPLTQYAVRDRAIVKKNDTIPATLVRKNMTVTVQVIALEDGRTGETIDVCDRETKKHFKANVCGEHDVRLMI